ncbi:hypothetical protein Bbelb_270000 [Branchiostoma belcheri]|nr:hypothetical protein Bbelb_270000 [Branchiostoma belcheri]
MVYSASPEVPARPARRIARRPKAGGRSDPREGWDRGVTRVRIVLWNIWKPRAVRVQNPRAVLLVITRAGTPVSNVIAAQAMADEPRVQRVGTVLRTPSLTFKSHCTGPKGPLPPQSPAAMGKGRTGRWKMSPKLQFQSCMQAVQDIGRVIVNLKMTTPLGSTLNDRAAY